MARWAAFRNVSIAWIEQSWGDNLISVVEHVDESHPHFSSSSWPLRFRPPHPLTSIHPGLRAEKVAAQRGVSKPDQKKAHQSAMKHFQDNFYFDDKRQRYDRLVDDTKEGQGGACRRTPSP